MPACFQQHHPTQAFGQAGWDSQSSILIWLMPKTAKLEFVPASLLVPLPVCSLKPQKFDVAPVGANSKYSKFVVCLPSARLGMSFA